MTRIQQLANLIIWPQDVHSIVSMSQIGKKALCRCNSDERIKNKTTVQRFASLPVNPNAKSYDSLGYISMESSTTYGSVIDNGEIYEPW